MSGVLAGEENFHFLEDNIARDVGDGFGEGKLFGAGFDAVLGEAALLHAAVAGEGAKTFFFEDSTGRIHVEELDLCDGCGANEVGRVIELRADLHADGAGDAVGEGVTLLLDLRNLARSWTEVVGAVDRNPGLDGLEVLEEDRAVDGE